MLGSISPDAGSESSLLFNNTANFDYICDIKELDAMTREFLDRDFMLSFIELAKIGVEYSHQESINSKQQLLSMIDSTIEFFKGDNLDKKTTLELVKNISTSVKSSIDKAMRIISLL